jgi:hypothetical protein
MKLASMCNDEYISGLLSCTAALEIHGWLLSDDHEKSFTH